MSKKKMKKPAKGKARAARPAKKASKPMKKKAAAKAAKKKVAAIPPGYHTVTAYLVCGNASDAMAFYAKAFGAKERFRMGGPDGKIMHAEMQLGSSVIMLSDEMMGHKSPKTLGGAAAQMFLYVPNVDKSFAQAVAAGATADMPPTDMFWGDRFGSLTDPFGHKWSMATHIEDVSPKEMERRGAAAFAEQGPGGQ